MGLARGESSSSDFKLMHYRYLQALDRGNATAPWQVSPYSLHCVPQGLQNHLTQTFLQLLVVFGGIVCFGRVTRGAGGCPQKRSGVLRMVPWSQRQSWAEPGP